MVLHDLAAVYEMWNLEQPLCVTRAEIRVEKDNLSYTFNMAIHCQLQWKAIRLATVG